MIVALFISALARRESQQPFPFSLVMSPQQPTPTPTSSLIIDCVFHHRFYFYLYKLVVVTPILSIFIATFFPFQQFHFHH
jgi:hypothetical protein